MGSKHAKLTEETLEFYNKTGDTTTLYAGSIKFQNYPNSAELYKDHINVVDSDNSVNKDIYYKDIATTSDVSTAISSQTKETWTFEVDNGAGGTTTVTKSIVLGE